MSHLTDALKSQRIIVNHDVFLLSDWKNILVLAKNKADLAHFLLEEIVRHKQNDKAIVVAIGWKGWNQPIQK